MDKGDLVVIISEVAKELKKHRGDKIKVTFILGSYCFIVIYIYSPV